MSGTIIRVHTRDFDVNGYVHHASVEAPQYEIKSSKTEHVAFHKGTALTRVRGCREVVAFRNVRRAFEASFVDASPRGRKGRKVVHGRAVRNLFTAKMVQR